MKTERFNSILRFPIFTELADDKIKGEEKYLTTKNLISVLQTVSLDANLLIFFYFLPS